MSFREEVLLSVFLPACILALLYFYARYLMLKAVFVRQLDAMHARLAQAQPLEGAELQPKHISWQTALDEASIRARSRLVRRHLAHPAYRDAVTAHETLQARVRLGMLITLLASGILMVLV